MNRNLSRPAKMIIDCALWDAAMGRTKEVYRNLLLAEAFAADPNADLAAEQMDCARDGIAIIQDYLALRGGADQVATMLTLVGEWEADHRRVLPQIINLAGLTLGDALRVARRNHLKQVALFLTEAIEEANEAAMEVRADAEREEVSDFANIQAVIDQHPDMRAKLEAGRYQGYKAELVPLGWTVWQRI